MAKSLKQLNEEQQNLFQDLKTLQDSLENGTAPENASERIDVIADALDQVETELNARTADLEKLKKRTAEKVNLRNAGNDGASLYYDIGGGRKLEIEANDPRQALCTPEYRKAFLNYIATGKQSEQLNLKVGDETKGGFFLPPAMSSEIIRFVDDAVVMRRLCRVITLGNSVSLGIPSWDNDPSDADWTPEVPATDLTTDTSVSIGRRELMPHGYQKLLKMSQKLLRSYPQMEAELQARAGYKLAVTEEKAFMTGDGNQKPLGVFTASSNGIPTSRDVTASADDEFTGDDVIDLLFNLKEQYQQRATFLVSRGWLKIARKLKSSDNGYLWTPGLGGMPGTILDRPYVMSEFVPSTFTTGQYVALVGDFSRYYIAESGALELQVINELFTLRNQVGYKLTRHVDGMPVLAEAFSRMKLG